MEPTKEIIWADVRFLSLCNNGKNLFRGLYKASGVSSVEAQMLQAPVDEADEKGLLSVIVWAPGFSDEDGEVATAETIGKFQRAAVETGDLALDILHNEQPVDISQASIVENWIVKDGDKSMDGVLYNGKEIKPGSLTGAWAATVHLKTPEMRELFRDGEISMGGGYKKRSLAKASHTLDMASMRKFIRKALRLQDGGDFSFSIHLPKQGEVDFNGSTVKPSFYVSINGDLSQTPE
jgi:hypothetical protein